MHPSTFLEVVIGHMNIAASNSAGSVVGFRPKIGSAPVTDVQNCG